MPQISQKLIISIMAVLLVAAITWFVLDKMNNQKEYLGFHYKNAVYTTDTLSQQKRLSEAPRFGSIQACLNWGNTLIAISPGDGFECSTGCRYDQEWESIVCKDTTKMITQLGKEGRFD